MHVDAKDDDGLRTGDFVDGLADVLGNLHLKPGLDESTASRGNDELMQPNEGTDNIEGTGVLPSREYHLSSLDLFRPILRDHVCC